MTLPGIDVASSFQGAPGRWMPLAGKIEWAAVKFTELSAAGPYTDPDAAADWAALQAAGIGRVAYLFGHPGHVRIAHRGPVPRRARQDPGG